MYFLKLYSLHFGILFDKSGPILVKYLLNPLTMSLLVDNSFPFSINVSGNLFLDFFLFIMLFNIFQVCFAFLLFINMIKRV